GRQTGQGAQFGLSAAWPHRNRTLSTGRTGRSHESRFAFPLCLFARLPLHLPRTAPSLERNLGNLMAARIVGVGKYLPERVLTNHELERMVETSDDWIVERTGIRERRIAAEDEGTASMGTIAARRALESAGLEPADIDLIICATCT